MTPLLGLAPDAPPDTPGILTSCASFIPFFRGFKAAPADVDPGVNALAAACRGSAVLTLLDSSRRLFAGTQTKLYELSGTSWVDVTDASGNYTGSSENRWSFAQFGNVSLASNSTEAINYSNGSGVFDNISNAPKAKVIFTVSGFIMALNFDDGTVTPDGWFCSGFQDYTAWTPSATTQCTKGRLFGTPGPFTAGARFGEEALAFKADAVYLGRYAGPPTVWQWTELSGKVGCVGQDAVCDVSTDANPMLFFVGKDGFYVYDGTRPRPIGVGKVRASFLAELNQTYQYRTQLLYDRKERNVYIYYCDDTATTGIPNKCLVYNVQNDTWGRDKSRQIESTLQFVSPGVTYDGLGALYTTYDDLPDIPYDSPYWSGGTQVPAVFNTSHKIQTLTGSGSSDCSFTTGDIGDSSVVSTYYGMRPSFMVKPTTAQHSNSYHMQLGDALLTDASTSYYDNKFDCMRSSRYHRSTVSTTGNMEINGFTPLLRADGER